MKENARRVFEYLLDNDGLDLTATDIAEDCGLKVKQVNGILTANGQKHRNAEGLLDPLMIRVPAVKEYYDEDGNFKVKQVNYIRLTQSGKEFDYWE